VAYLPSKRSWRKDRAMSLNLSIDADPHLQEAAPPQGVVVRSFLR
jgi:hypothetical protein